MPISKCFFFYYNIEIPGALTRFFKIRRRALCVVFRKEV